MNYGFVIPIGDVLKLPALAVEIEQAGWDAAFVADAMAIAPGGKPFPWYDPWVALGAMAMVTTRIKMGTFIAAVPRRRPWKLAREISTLDQLSGGRVIFGAGLGAADDDAGFGGVGEPVDLRVRAELLDESLEIIAGLWKGKTYSFDGAHHHVDRLIMTPGPVQKPRVPIWIPGVWPKEKSLQRTLRWDGLIPQQYQGSPGNVMTADQIAEISAYIRKNRRKRSPFDLICGGVTPGSSPKKAAQQVQAYADAGATWWVEGMWSSDLRQVIRRIKQGPPKL